MAVTLKINKSSYSLKFGIGCLRLLGEMWNCKTINEVLAKIAILDGFDVNDIPFEILDVMESVLKAAIFNDKSNVIVESDFDDLMEYVFENPLKIQKALNELALSMPQANQGKKPIPAKKKK